MTHLTPFYQPEDICSISLELASIAELAYSDPMWAKDRLASLSVPSEFLYLKDAVFSHVVWAKNTSIVNEFDMQRKFFNHLDKFIPYATRIDYPVIKNHQPDGFVEIDGRLYVVEVKLNLFLNSSLAQIKRYIKAYSAAGGIAVASGLRCVLPKNIMFVALS